MYNKDKILQTMRDVYEESKVIKPYVVICQPRRDLNETPMQNFDGYEGLHVDLCGFSHGFCNVGGEAVDVARNYLMDQAIESGAKYLLFVGEDTVLPYDAFMKLHATAEKNPGSVVAGVYYIKLSIPMIMIRNDDFIIPADVTPGQIYEAWQTGMDAMLIPIDILKKMKEDDPEIPFCCIGNKIEDLPFIGEDNFFVYRLRKMGYRLLVDTDVQALHCDIEYGWWYNPMVSEEEVRTKYFTTVPLTREMVFEDKKTLDHRWLSRLPKPNKEGSNVETTLIDPENKEKNE